MPRGDVSRSEPRQPSRRAVRGGIGTRRRQRSRPPGPPPRRRSRPAPCGATFQRIRRRNRARRRRGRRLRLALAIRKAARWRTPTGERELVLDDVAARQEARQCSRPRDCISNAITAASRRSIRRSTRCRARHGGTAKKFSMADIKRFPSVTRKHFIECSGNGLTEWNKPTLKTAQGTHGLFSTSEWTGVQFARSRVRSASRTARRWVLAEGVEPR